MPTDRREDAENLPSRGRDRIRKRTTRAVPGVRSGGKRVEESDFPQAISERITGSGAYPCYFSSYEGEREGEEGEEETQGSPGKMMLVCLCFVLFCHLVLYGMLGLLVFLGVE